MTKVTGSSIEFVKVLAVSGGLLLLALSGSNVLLKFVSVKYPVAVAHLRTVKDICKLQIALFPSLRDGLKSDTSEKCSISPVTESCCNYDESNTETFILFEDGINRRNSKSNQRFCDLLYEKRLQSLPARTAQTTLAVETLAESAADREEIEVLIGEKTVESSASSHNFTVEEVPPPVLSLSGPRKLVRPKKKVSFAASIVEPKGDSKEYRRNSKSSKKHQVSSLHAITATPRRLDETGLRPSDTQSTAIRSERSSRDFSDQSVNAEFRNSDTRESCKIRRLLGTNLPENRIALYSGMYRDRVLRTLI